MKKKTLHYPMRNIWMIGILSLLLLLFGATILTQNIGLSTPIGRGDYSVPTWSPNGQFGISFVRRDVTPELWLYDNQSALWQLIPLSSLESPYLNGAWRDNDTYLFTSYKSNKESLIGDARLLSLNVSSMSVEVLMDIKGSFDGTIHPIDSDELLFDKVIDSPEGLILAINLDDLTISEYDIQPHDSAHNILWSPDGIRLAYQYAGDGIPRYKGRGIGILENGETTEFDLPLRIGENVYTWSPNSSAILFVGHYETKGLYLLDLNGTNSQPVLIKEGQFAEVSWSPDGSTVAYTTLTFAAENELYLVPAEELGLEHYKVDINDT